MEYRDIPDETLIKRMHQGDTHAEDALIQRYKSNVRRKVRGFFLVGGDSEDLVQEGMIGLFKAIRSFQPTGGASFRTYAELCIERQILSAIQAATRKKQTPLNSYVSFAERVYGDENAQELGDSIPDPDMADPAQRLIEQEQHRQLCLRIRERLSPLEKEVLRLHIEGLSYQDIAAQLAHSPKSVDNALQRIRRKTRSVMEEWDV